MSSLTPPAGETSLIVESLPSAGTGLARAMQDGTLPAAWGVRALRGRATLLDRARRTLVAWTPDAREALWRWASEATALSAADATARERLRAAITGGLVVTTGQQPGLLGGPLYTWHKALSAIALADALEQALGVAVAPLFWAATDDADFAEGASTWLPTAQGSVRVRIDAPREAGNGVPVSALPLPDMQSVLTAFDAACGSSADSEVRAAVHAAYVPGATVGGAYVHLLRSMLEPRGMAVLDASHASVRAAAHPVTVRALAQASQVDEQLRAREAALMSAGFAAQVEQVDGLSLVFQWSDQGKTRVPIADAVARSQTVGASELSGNVLLRPVIERALLPTIAYVAGPGELSYFAQVGAVAEALGIDAPAAVARWSARIVEGRVAAAAVAVGRPLSDFHDVERLLHEVARDGLPAAVREALTAVRDTIRSTMATVTDAAAPLGMPHEVSAGAERQLLHRLERYERRIVARSASQDLERRARIALVAGALFPGGAPQERGLNAMPLLARYGGALWAAWQAGADRWAAQLLDEAT
jgi:bacillithiol synthase